MRHLILAVTVAAGLAAESPAAAAILNTNVGEFFPVASGWLDDGSTSAGAEATTLDSRGYFAFVILPGVLRGNLRFTGNDYGRVSTTQLIVTYTLHEIASLPADLAAPGTSAAAASPAAAAAASLFAALGDGAIIGSATVTPAVDDLLPGPPPVAVSLNAVGIAAVNAAARTSTPFIIGVTAEAVSSSPAIRGVFAPLSGGASAPEPATWLMMVTGFGLCGALLRRRYLIPSIASSTASTDGRTL